MPRKKTSEKRKAKKPETKIAKPLAIACAIIALLSFMVKEVVKEHFKDLHDARRFSYLRSGVNRHPLRTHLPQRWRAQSLPAIHSARVSDHHGNDAAQGA